MGTLKGQKVKTRARCRYCGWVGPKLGINFHTLRRHPGQAPSWDPLPPVDEDKSVASTSSLDGKTAPPPKPTPDKAATPTVRTVPYGGIMAVYPHSFSTTSTFLWQVKDITEREWGFPKMEPGEWLDMFLYAVMRKFGYHLGAYIREQWVDDQLARLRNGTAQDETAGADAGGSP